MTSAVGARKAGGPAPARRHAVPLAVMLALGAVLAVRGSGAYADQKMPGPDRQAAALMLAQAPAEPDFAPAPAPPPPAAGVTRGGGRSITRAEFLERRRQAAIRRGRDPDRAVARAAEMFDAADTNHDGVVDAAERAAFEAAHPELHRRGHQR